MIRYFPRREDVKGFTTSLKNKMKERLMNDLDNTKPTVKQVINIHRPRVGIGHWANRGFEEYKDAA